MKTSVMLKVTCDVKDAEEERCGGHSHENKAGLFQLHHTLGLINMAMDECWETRTLQNPACVLPMFSVFISF